MEEPRNKVFLDTELWEYCWFQSLPMEYQFTYIYLWTECDRIGVLEPDTVKMAILAKVDEFDLETFYQRINSEEEKIKKLRNGNWLLIDYLPFQVEMITDNIEKPQFNYIENVILRRILVKYLENNPGRISTDEVYEFVNFKVWEVGNEKNEAEKALSKVIYGGFMSLMNYSAKFLEKLVKLNGDHITDLCFPSTILKLPYQDEVFGQRSDKDYDQKLGDLPETNPNLNTDSPF
ncbi:hypothetical protein [Fodinibius saliphilus]|uniref:hypothetical protein n=1 Tax=Fodinibius saliphilus TaxID=1920650 RepID=UPI0011091F84|nr:hypothetical protein [Fodinibius saliphilus]